MVTEQECIFCKIVRGEIPSKKIYEDHDVIAFLDINPANPGHCLVVPKKHSETISDTDDDVLVKAIVVTKKLATAVKEKLNADGVNIVQNNGRHAGQLVSHIHFHIIPRFPDDKVLITYQRVQMDENALNEMQKKLTEEGKKESRSDWDMRF
ncbi:MAG: HIT family protein [Candidatus Aenigmarchaeota archaeon]|nr:HIT family protein [Candidatus Aenigmarchaeota archaeon]